MARLKVAVLISGRGSNLRALLAACADPDFPAQIVLVVSDRKDAGGLAHANAFGIPSTTVQRSEHANRAAFEDALDGAVRASGADLVCLAGFMRLLSGDFLAGWGDRILNIHPSLLPAFRGLDTHERALAAGVRISGCTVHIVRPAMDDGPILVQAAVRVLPHDSPETLASRVLAAEHLAYPLALRLMAENKLQIIDDQVVFRDPADRPGPEKDAMLIAP